MPPKLRQKSKLPIEERLWEAARIRLFYKGVSCPTREEVNEEVDLFNSEEAREQRRLHKHARFRLNCPRNQE